MSKDFIKYIKMKYNSNYSHDLEVGQVFEKELGYILEKKAIECKKDLLANKTGNVFIEYFNLRSNKKSGISTTKAEWHAIWINEHNIRLIGTNYLKQKCRKYLNTKRDVKGGDKNTSKGILLPIDEI